MSEQSESLATGSVQLFCEATTVENPILKWLVGPVFGQRQRATTIETGKFDKLIQLRND